MKPIAPGTRYSFTVQTGKRDTAEAFGNAGFLVVGTPALVGFLETAADRCLRPFYEGNEGSVGVTIEVAHLAPALENAIVEARAEVVSLEGRKVRFALEARLEETVLMKGVHDRAVVDMERFLAKLGVRPAKR